MNQPPLFVKNRRPNRAALVAASSTVARFVRRAVVASLMLSLVAEPTLAQSLPGHFQFREKRVFANGTSCTFLSDVTIQGDFVLVAPLKRDCTNETNEFSSEEGYVFPFNGKDAHSRDCRVAKGDEPVMTCSDGESLALRGFTANEPLRIDSTISHASQWTGSRLVLDLNDTETRFTMAGGSGRRAQKLRKVYHLEFSFAGGQCVIETIKRSRLSNGRNENIVAVKGLGCTIVR